MKHLRLIPMIILPLAMGALLTSADAQGKGKGQGAAKPNPGQGQGAGPVAKGPASPSMGKAAKGPAAQPPARAGVTARQAGPPANHGQAPTARNQVQSGRPAEHMTGHAGNASPRANAALAANRGQAVSRFVRNLQPGEIRPMARALVISDRPSHTIAGGAIAYAFARGAPESAFLITPTAGDVAVRNRNRDLLIALNDDQAQNLGEWQVRPIIDNVGSGAPSFCRSGAGHPVWGRQWCLEKGFGLGTQPDLLWGATGDVGDVIFGRTLSPTLSRDGLLALLGNVAFDRLALHALTLGYTDPLSGLWRSDATGSDVLLVNSGVYPVAEIVDGNRDQRPDLMLVALRPW
jgi:hypothetical protein